MISAPETTSAVAPGKPVGGTVKFGANDSFQRDLKRRVDGYFRFTGLSQRDSGWMYLKSFVILLWFFASYAALVFSEQLFGYQLNWWEATLLSISFGMAAAGIGFSIQHDGNHRGYSDKNWVNRLAARSLDMLGASSYIWGHKHNTVHHTYANIGGHDDDIELGYVGRLAPHQPRRWFHRIQHWYLWLLYGFLPVKWQLFDDFCNVARARIGAHKFARPRGWEALVFWGGKALFFTTFFVIPSLFHPFWQVALFYFIASWIKGVLLSVVFQLAHVVEEADFPMPDASGRIESDWAAHQVRTTVNFSRNSRVLCWYLGGLNFQIEHHLFPRICHIHYPKISRIVEHVCKEHGVPYNVHRSFLAGVMSHYRWLRTLSRSPVVAALPANATPAAA